MERRVWIPLAERARDGDRRAFDELVKIFSRPLCAAIHPLVHDWHIAQDIAQEALANIYEQIHLLDPPEHFRAWLFTIARRRAVSRYRRRSRVFSTESVDREPVRGVFRGAECRPDAVGPGRGPSSDALARVRRAILALPNDYGSVLLMRYLEGMTVPEIAEAIGRTPKATRSVLYRARQLARDQLEKAGLDLERILHEM